MTLLSFALFSTRVPFLAITFLIFNSSLSAFSNVAYFVYLSKNIKEEELATAYAGTSGVQQIASILAPALGTLLWGFGPQVLVVASGLLSFITLPLVALFERKE